MLIFSFICSILFALVFLSFIVSIIIFLIRQHKFKNQVRSDFDNLFDFTKGGVDD